MNFVDISNLNHYSVRLRHHNAELLQAMIFLNRNCPPVGIYNQKEHIQLVEINFEYIPRKGSFHTLFHVLGRYHEHQRPDRDQYIKVQWNNIREGNLHLSWQSLIIIYINTLIHIIHTA